MLWSGMNMYWIWSRIIPLLPRISDLSLSSTEVPPKGPFGRLIGESLKLTPFRLQNIPPPMAGSELLLSSTPTHVAFDSTGQYFAILRRRGVDIATWSAFSKLRIRSPQITHAFRYRRLSPC
jgi:IKI3 family